MKYEHEPIYPNKVPQYVTPPPPPIVYTGLTIYNKIAIEAMQALIIRADGLIYTPDEISDKACEYAAALCRRLP